MTAPLLESWRRRYLRSLTGTPNSGSTSQAGTPILVAQFGGSLRLVVEIAFGYTYPSDATGWVWADVTGDVQVGEDGHISITRGRQDESSHATPAQCTLTLKNGSGKYSQSALGALYPNIRRNVPLRVRLIFDSRSYTRFIGYVTKWPAEFDTSGRYAVVNVQANGVLQRLQQGQQVLASVMARGIPNYTANPAISYWPCEDVVGATQLASGLAGFPPLSFTRATPTLAAYSGFVASNPIPQANGSSWHATIPAYTQASPNQLQLQFFLNVPSTGAVDGTILTEIHTTGTGPRWEIMYNLGGKLSLKVYDYFGNLLFDTGAIAFLVNGVNELVVLQLTQSGANVNWLLCAYPVTTGTAGFTSGTFTAVTLGIAQSIHIFPGGENTTVAIGQIIVQALVDANVFALNSYVNAWIGDTPGSRISRLCTENGELANFNGASDQTMGAQLPKTFIQLIQEAELADGGLVADGGTFLEGIGTAASGTRGAGVTLYVRNQFESVPASLVLDASKGEISDFAPADDDLLNLNYYTATRQGGSSAIASDLTGPFGVNAIGQYPGSDTINCQYDVTLPHYAGWAVHRGTTFGPTNSSSYRYPTVPVRVQAKPYLINQVLLTDLLCRIDLLNIHQVRAQQQDFTISNQVQGYTEIINKFQWEPTYTCTPYEVARVAILAQDTGDTGEFVARLDTDGSQVVGDTPAGSATITVATPSGPLWTTLADDFPLVVNMGDIPVTVTNITGSSSPQTFTVTGSTVTKLLPNGTAVSVWNMTVLGM